MYDRIPCKGCQIRNISTFKSPYNNFQVDSYYDILLFQCISLGPSRYILPTSVIIIIGDVHRLHWNHGVRIILCKFGPCERHPLPCPSKPDMDHLLWVWWKTGHNITIMSYECLEMSNYWQLDCPTACSDKQQHYWPFCEEKSTSVWWFPSQRASYVERACMSWRRQDITCLQSTRPSKSVLGIDCRPTRLVRDLGAMWYNSDRTSQVQPCLFGNSVLNVFYRQLSAVKTWSSTTWFCIWYDNDWGKICIRGYIHKRHPRSCPHGVSNRVSFVRIWVKIVCVITTPHCIWRPYSYNAHTTSVTIWWDMACLLWVLEQN